MKDYYYFLGIKSDASDEDIKKAYRKLSLKYHPDKNPGDEFFADRFREVQEAYDVLGSPENRKEYDRSYEHNQRSTRSALPPHIKSFSSNKIQAVKGEEIILKWQTNNADVVKILPFGLEKTFGERSFKITEFKDGKFHVVLQATNTLRNMTVVKGITISEVFERIVHEPSRRMEGSSRPNPEDLHEEKGIPRSLKILLVVVLIIITIIAMLIKNGA